MMVAKRDEFEPDWVSPPGETIADILEERNISLADFMEQMGCTVDAASDLLRGRVTITAEIARRLEVVLGVSSGFWMSRESQYRGDLARVESTSRSPSVQGWLSELPLKDMIKFRWLLPSAPSAAAQAAACLNFFGVPDIDTWRQTYRVVAESAAFRTSPSFKSRPGAVAAWLRQGEIEATSIDCRPWDAKRFAAELLTIRRLTWKKAPKLFVPALQKVCAECGVAVVIVRAPAGCRASGATRFLSHRKALLMLSFRYLSDDHFWFTFFHEAGHLVLHDMNSLFLEGEDRISTKEEGEANEFSAAVLIPAEFRADLMTLRGEGREVIRFARRVGVSPGVIVGQLQHLGRVRRNQLNRLKRRFVWAEA
jgi:plasmid maintenance system antidote protein VapI